MPPNDELNIQEEIRRVLEENMALREQQAQQVQDDIALEKQRLNLVRDRLKVIKGISESFQLDQELRQAQLQQDIDLLQNKVDTLAQEERELLILRDQLESRGELTREAKDYIEAQHKELQNQQAALEGSREQLRLDHQRINALEQTNEITKDVLQSLTGVTDRWKNTFLGGVMLADDLAGSLKAIGAAFAEQMSPANMFGSLLLGIKEQTMEALWAYDNTRVSLRQLTGQTQKYDETLNDVYFTSRDIGASFEDVGGAMEALHGSMSGFSELNVQAREDVTKFTVTMEKLGIQFETTGELQDDFTKGLGFSGKEAMRIQKELMATAKAIDMQPREMMEGMQKSMPVLASYGTKAPEVFKRVAAAAKATGVETSKLISYMEKFDTFEDAAGAVGKLNAILGGPYMNTVEMLSADEEERIQLLRDGVTASGKSWQSLGKFEKKALAAAAGISDMNEAAKILGSSASEYEKFAAAAEQEALSQKEMEERARAVMPVFEKQMALLKLLAVDAIMPLVNAIHWFLDGLMSLDKTLGGWLIPTLITLIGFIWVASKATKIWTAVTKTWTAITAAAAWVKGLFTTATAASTVAEEVDSLAKGVNTIQTNINTTSQTINTSATWAGVAAKLAMGVAIAIVILSVVLLVYAIVDLAEAMKGMGHEAWALVAVIAVIMTSVIVMISTFAALAPVTMTAAIPMLLFGGALFLVGAAIALIMYSIAALVDSITGLFTVMLENHEVLGEVVAQMTLLGAAMFSIGLGGVAASGGLMAMAVGMAIFAAAFWTVSTEDLQAFSVAMASMANIDLATIGALSGLFLALALAAKVGGIESIAWGLTLISSATREMNVAAVAKLTEMFTAISTVTAETVSNIGLMAVALQEVVNVVGDLATDKAIVFTTMVKGVGTSMESIGANVTPEVVTNTKALVTQAVRYSDAIQEEAAATTPAFERLLDKLAEVVGGKSAGKPGGGGGKGQPIIIQVNLDGTKIGESAEEYLAVKHGLFI